MKNKIELVTFNKKSAEIIPFPVRAQKKELKIMSMKCCKTEMMDWNFTKF